jgi:hypothetical protein
LGDGGGGEAAMVGEEDQGALMLLVPNLDTAQEQVALTASQLIKEDDLIAPDSSLFLKRKPWPSSISFSFSSAAVMCSFLATAGNGG